MAGPANSAIQENKGAILPLAQRAISIMSLASTAQKPARVAGRLALLSGQAFRADIMPHYEVRIWVREMENIGVGSVV